MHMSRTVVQIPVSTDLRDSAHQMALSQGFSSLQEALRVIMHRFSSGTLRVDVYSEPAPVKLSAKAIKRYDQMTKDFQSGKNMSKVANIEELMAQLKYGDKPTQKIHQKLSTKNISKSKINKEIQAEARTIPR